MEPAATAAIGTATMASDAASPHTMTVGTIRQPYSVRTAADRQNPFSSHNRCAPSTAANSAPMTPTPCPATISSLTPASWSARSTPA